MTVARSEFYRADAVLLDVLEQLPWIEGLMSERELERLATIAADVMPDQAIVEIGSYRGRSSSVMAAAARFGNGARVTAIDLWPQPNQHERDLDHADRQRGALEAFTATMEAQGWPVTPLRAHSVNIADSWIQPVGLAFIDGDHSYAAVAHDYHAWGPLVARGGVIAFHDYFDDADLSVPGDTARVIDELVMASGLWADEGLTDKLWIGRRL